MSTFKKTTLQADVTMIDLSADFTGGGWRPRAARCSSRCAAATVAKPATPRRSRRISAIFPMGDSGVTLGAMSARRSA
jgi:hypothetical protein